MVDGVSGSFEKSVLDEGTIGAPDIRGYAVHSWEHGVDIGDLDHRRIQFSVGIDRDIGEAIEENWRLANLNNPDADWRPPQFSQFSEDIQSRMNAVLADKGIQISANISGVPLSMLDTEEVTLNNNSPDGVFCVGNNHADSEFTNPESSWYQEEGYIGVTAFNFLVADDGKLSQADLMETVRQAYYEVTQPGVTPPEMDYNGDEPGLGISEELKAAPLAPITP